MQRALHSIWRFLNHRIVLRIVGLGLGGLFVYASYDKVTQPDRFADIVNDYQMLPLVFINAFALVMPWFEMVAGAALVLGLWRRAAGLILAALTVAFMVAIAQAEIRGLEIECGCFDVSGMSATQASWDLFVRDLGLLLASALIWRRA
ncbi:MAG: DoxX family membrane protein [Armatimonadota bacterium]|nr:MAG: DoxX family membrane protein [Armatimonadota bacterium]